MCPQRLFNSPTYSPEDLHVMREAFDIVWQRIASTVSNKPSSIDAARLKVADAVLSLAKDGVKSPEELADRVLMAMSSDDVLSFPMPGRAHDTSSGAQR